MQNCPWLRTTTIWLFKSLRDDTDFISFLLSCFCLKYFEFNDTLKWTTHSSSWGSHFLICKMNGLDIVISEYLLDLRVDSVEGRRPLWGLCVYILSKQVIPLAHPAPVTGSCSPGTWHPDQSSWWFSLLWFKPTFPAPFSKWKFLNIQYKEPLKTQLPHYPFHLNLVKTSQWVLSLCRFIHWGQFPKGLSWAGLGSKRAQVLPLRKSQSSGRAEERFFCLTTIENPSFHFFCLRLSNSCSLTFFPKMYFLLKWSWFVPLIVEKSSKKIN